MAVKKKTEKQTSSWIGEVEKYSRQIWLAGLGAYSKVSKDGTKLFDTLVKDGEKAEKLAKSEVDKQVGVVKAGVGSAKSKVDEVKDKAIGKWSELEEAFDKRLNSAISRLGVPSRNEVKALQTKVDSLTKQIEKLTGQSVKPVAKAAAKPAAKKEEAKPSNKKFVFGALGIAAFGWVAAVAPAAFLSHFTVFILACVVGYYVVWNVSHALHTPLMSVTNAISGIIVVGALLQIGQGSTLVTVLAFVAVLIASINIFGGFTVTQRMLKMFRKD